MVKKIIFFVESPFSSRDYDRFGVEILRNNGFEVEVWDFTPFLHAKIYGQINESSPARYDRMILFNSKKDALSAIQRLSTQDMIVCLVAYCVNSIAIYKTMSASGLRYSVLMSNV